MMGWEELDVVEPEAEGKQKGDKVATGMLEQVSDKYARPADLAHSTQEAPGRTRLPLDCQADTSTCRRSFS